MNIQFFKYHFLLISCQVSSDFVDSNEGKVRSILTAVFSEPAKTQHQLKNNNNQDFIH